MKFHPSHQFSLEVVWNWKTLISSNFYAFHIEASSELKD